MKHSKMKSNEMLLDFGTIMEYEKSRVNETKKNITLTVYSNATWILLAKPCSDDSRFKSLFIDEDSPLSYCIKTMGSHSNNRFYPFIQDDYVILASGEKTSEKGNEIEIQLRLNNLDKMGYGSHNASIDFVLLTREKYMRNIQYQSNKFSLASTSAKT